MRSSRLFGAPDLGLPPKQRRSSSRGRKPQRSSQVRHGGQTYTHGPWRSHLGWSNPQVEKKVRQFEGGRNTTDVGLRIVFQRAPGLFGRGLRMQQRSENMDAFRPNSPAAKAWRSGGIDALARELARRSKMIEATGKGGTKGFRGEPYSRLMESNELGDRAFGWVYPDRSVHLRSDVYDAIGERGVATRYGAARPKDMILGRYKRSYSSKGMNPSLANSVLLHELVHSYAQGGQRLPKWLAEGEAHAVTKNRAKPTFEEMGMPYSRPQAGYYKPNPYDDYARKYVQWSGRKQYLTDIDPFSRARLRPAGRMKP